MPGGNGREVLSSFPSDPTSVFVHPLNDDARGSLSRGHQTKKVVSILELDRQIATTTADAAADADAGADADDDPDPNAGLDPRPRRGTTDKYHTS